MDMPIEIPNNPSQKLVKGFGEFKANELDFTVNAIKIGLSEKMELCPKCQTLQVMKICDLKKSETEKIRSYYCSACRTWVRSENIRTVKK